MEGSHIQTSAIEASGKRIAADITNSSRRIALLCVAAVASAVVTPMFFLGNASGHDFQFHLASWLDVAGQWREGIAYPRWAEWANWGFGEPRFIFYPPGSWMLGVGLGSLLPWRIVPGAFIWLALVLAGFGMWRLAREWLPNRQAQVAGVLFAVNPYHLVIVYYRSDFAELLASSLFPLLVLGALRVVRDGWSRVPTPALVFALIWLSNAPAAVIATYSLAFIFAVGSVIRGNASPLLRGGVAMAVGFGLAAFYILPAAWEQRWVQISQVLAENLRPSRNFLFTHSNDPEFVLFNWKVSAVALGIILVTGVAAVFVARQRRNLLGAWWTLVTLAFVSSFLMFPPSIFFWEHLPKLQFVQFPWRWLLPLDVALAFFIAAALQTSRKLLLGWLAILIATGAIGRTFVKDAWWDSEDIPVLEEGIRSGHGYEGTDEYQPLGCDRYQLPGQAPASADDSEVPSTSLTESAETPKIEMIDSESGAVIPFSGEDLRIDRWTAETKSFGLKTSQPVTLAPRLINYPAWEIHVDKEIVHGESLPETAQLSLPVPAGQHLVDIHFRRTWDRTAGAAISVVSCFLLLGFTAYTRRKTEHAD
jgi:hypothetical protein